MPVPYRFIAKVTGDVKASLTDKPAKVVLFDDGAEVTFYTEKHPRAKKALKHVYMMHESVHYEIVECADEEESQDQSQPIAEI